MIPWTASQWVKVKVGFGGRLQFSILLFLLFCFAAQTSAPKGTEHPVHPPTKSTFRRAQSGSPKDEFALAEAYSKGVGIVQSDSEALLWYRRSAEHGNVVAMCRLGYMYALGIGTERDDHQAFLWFLRAATEGDLTAQGNLAIMYFGGLGVGVDIESAVHWWQQAAAKGETNAR